MTSPWIDAGDATITELDGARQGHSSSGPGHPGGGGMPSAYVFAAGVMVGAALIIAIMERPESEAPQVTAEPSVSTPVPRSSPIPSQEPSGFPEPVHLPIGHPVSVEIDGMLVSLSVPLTFESAYYAPHLLSTGRPDGPGLVITTTDQVGTGCLRLEDADGALGGSPGPTATPLEELPTTAAARGPVAFTLDGYRGNYFHFLTPAGGCHPNQVWDGIVGDFGARGASVELELWALDVNGTTLVLGSYAVRDAPAEHLDELRTAAASVQIAQIQPSPASLTPAIIEAGFIGLPPVGANPSAPVPALLVDEYPILGDVMSNGLPLLGMVRIYDDGRMIWYRFFDGPVGELDRSTGYLQQRLTPLGVAMVQAHSDRADKDPLALAQWLPPDAWDDPEVRGYVSTQYAACLELVSAPVSPVFLVDLLPSTAADLLRVKPLVSGGQPGWECRGMTSDEARIVASELQVSGFQQNQDANRYVLEYELGNTVVTFEPIFPDGTIGCSGCG